MKNVKNPENGNDILFFSGRRFIVTQEQSTNIINKQYCKHKIFFPNQLFKSLERFRKKNHLTVMARKSYVDLVL